MSLRGRYAILLILTVVSGLRLSGQNDTASTRIRLAYPVYSQYLHNGLLINPAYAGSREVLSFFASGRDQWANLTGAPMMETVSLHSLLKNERVGLGLSGQFCQYGDASYGMTRFTSVYADYAYHVKLSAGHLSFGLKAGFDMSSSKYTDAFRQTLTNPNDPVFKDNQSYFLPNAGAGIYYYGKKFFAGASVPAFLGYMRTSDSKLTFRALDDFDLYFTTG